MVQDTPKTDHYIRCSDRIVLDCKCGERLVLLGLEEDWHSEQSVFECVCGEKLTLADRNIEGAPDLRDLIRDLRVPATHSSGPGGMGPPL